MQKIYFDCGIIKNVIHNRKPERCSNFYTQLRDRKVLENQNPFFICSSLVLLEIAGLKVETIINPAHLHKLLEKMKADNRGRVSPEQFLADFFSAIRDLFYVDQLLTKNFLKDRIKDEMKYRDQWGRDLLKKIFLKGVSESKVRSIHQDLVLELVQCVEYEIIFNKEELTKIDTQLFRTFLTLYLLRNQNTPFFRIIAKVYERLTGNSLLVPFQELADCEIVHFALLGHWIKDKVTPVTIMTNEELESWKERIKTALAFINISNKIIIPENNKVPTNPKLELFRLIPGKIYFVDPHSGDIREEILDVKKYVESISS